MINTKPYSYYRLELVPYDGLQYKDKAGPDEESLRFLFWFFSFKPKGEENTNTDEEGAKKVKCKDVRSN